jgi:hypothetical protein
MELTVTQADNDRATIFRGRGNLVCATCPVAQAFLRIGYHVRVSPMRATVEMTGKYIEFPDDLSLAIMKYDATSRPILGTFEVTLTITHKA